MDLAQYKGKKVLVTGVTGWVAGPIATGLASAGATVYGASRFAKAEQHAEWQAHGHRQTRAEVEEKRDHDDHRRHHRLPQGGGEGLRRLQNEPRAVVERDHRQLLHLQGGS